ncbi:hypothetical protein [Eudoraea sp.]|uniref:hypothetical protein n=1 Tax=Eudoraea sp. TaxID=1979955 RepID=UPI003C751D75
MNYKVKSIFYLSGVILASLLYQNILDEEPNDKDYASLEEVRISHEKLKKVSEEVLKSLQ